MMAGPVFDPKRLAASLERDRARHGLARPGAWMKSVKPTMRPEGDQDHRDLGGCDQQPPRMVIVRGRLKLAENLGSRRKTKNPKFSRQSETPIRGDDAVIREDIPTGR